MTKKQGIQLFEEKRVRTVWDDELDPGAYWRKLKERLRKEGNETVTNCHGLKLTAA